MNAFVQHRGPEYNYRQGGCQDAAQHDAGRCPQELLQAFAVSTAFPRHFFIFRRKSPFRAFRVSMRREEPLCFISRRQPMDTFLDNRLRLSVPDDGFDPVSEIRRLRQDLMARLQRLQQSVATETEASVDKTEESVCRAEAAPPSPDSPSESGTILYVSPDFQRSDDAPATEEAAAFIDSLLDRPETKTPLRIVSETGVAGPSSSIAAPRKESLPAQILGWINVVLVCIGITGAGVGLYHFVLRKHFTGPQGLAMTLLVVGVAMVVVGIVGRLSHRHAKFQFAGTAGPGSW